MSQNAVSLWEANANQAWHGGAVTPSEGGFPHQKTQADKGEGKAPSPSLGLGITYCTASEREAFIQQMLVMGTKTTANSQEYLARTMTTAVFQDALRILREKVMV